MNNNNYYISIEGNIGSGKSTLLDYLKNYYKTDNKVIFVNEPVDEWEKIKDENKKSILENFYLDQEKYSFPFQIIAFISRLTILRKIYQENKNCIIISERSLYTDKLVFAKMLHDDKKMDLMSYNIYLHLFNEFINDFPVNHLVYVNTSSSICSERIVKRDRKGENLIKLDYLIKCHQYHEAMITYLNKNILELNGNNNIKDEIDSWINKINNIIINKP